MEDAAKQLRIPELYEAVMERLDMLNMYIRTAYQLHSNVLFVILNTLFLITSVFSFVAFLRQAVSLVEVAIIVTISALWLVAVTHYFSRYAR